MTEQLQYQKFLLLGRVCEIHAVAERKRPGRKSKAQVMAEEAQRLITEAEGETASRRELDSPGRPVTDGHGFIKKRLLENLESITTGMFTDAGKMKPATLKLLWDLGKMNEKAESQSHGDELTLSKLLLSELKQKNKPAGELHEQA